MKSSQLVCQTFYPVFVRNPQNPQFQNVPFAFFQHKEVAETFAKSVNGIVGSPEVPLTCTHTEKFPHVQEDRNKQPVVLALPRDDSSK
jgi:hypothetical protein